MRRYKKVLIIVASSIVFLLVSLVTISIVYESRISAYFLSTLNEKLEAEIKAKNINFSLLAKFPFASIRLDSMTIEPKNHKLPALYSAKTTFLEFNILDVFSGNYAIRNIEVRKGKLVLFTSAGARNFDLFKKTEGNAKFNFALRNVRLSDIALSIEDHDKEFFLKSYINTAAVKGKFSEAEYDISAKLNGKLKELTQKNNSILKQKTIDLTTDLHVSSEVYSIRDCNLSLQGIGFNIEGSVDNSKAVSTDLKIVGDDITLTDLYKLLPQRLTPKADEYESEGNLDFIANISGPVDSSLINAEFTIKKGHLVYKADNVELKNIDLSGKISNGKQRSMRSSKLQLTNFYAETNGGRISGNLTIKDFTDPNLSINAKAVTALEHILPFIKQDKIISGKGRVEVQAHYEGRIRKAEKASQIAAINSGGVIKGKNVTLVFKDKNTVISDLNTELLLNKNDLIIRSLDLKYNNTPFRITGSFDNLIPALFLKDEYPVASLDLYSPDADLGIFFKTSSTPNKDTTTVLAFPFRTANFTVKLDKTHYEKFEASDVTGTFTLRNNILTGENVAFNTMEGKVSFEGTAHIIPKGVVVKASAAASHINISKLFYEFNNFGQETLTDQNLKGIGDADVNFQCFWNKKLDFDPSSLTALCNISIDKGELNNFEPLYLLGKYISLNELKNIRFSKLQNNFVVKDNKVIFPDMNINSNALNLTVSGTHYFSNRVDYHFQLLLNDLLWQKAKKAKPQNEDFGVEEDDGLGKINLFVSMTGDLDSPVFTYDKKGLRKNIKDEAKSEKLVVKSMLKKDLGLFRADSSLKTPASKKDKPLQVQWDENEKSDEKKTDQKTTKEKSPDKKGKVGKLLNKVAKPDGEERSGQNSDDFN
jgi:hypothetical protein